MFEDVSGRIGALVALVGAIGLSLLIGSCVQDYRLSTPRVIDVQIVDKHYSPAHSDLVCTSDKNGMSCHTNYYPESWSVDYADGEQWSLSVSRGTWEALRIGDRKVLRFNEGGGWWHARYDEQFEFGALVAEGALPVK
jgi:hypothetical protein